MKILSSIALILLLSSCTPIDSVVDNLMGRRANYYRQAELNGRYEIVGRFPVPDEMAQNVNCYHFFYADSGQLIKVEYLKGGRLSEGGDLGAPRVIIEPSEGFEKRIYQDVRGNPTTNEDGVHSVRLRLNESNHPIASFNYNEKAELIKDNKGVAQYSWTLDEEGRRIKSMRLDEAGNRITDEDGVYEVRWEYDGEGNVVEYTNFGVDGQMKESNDGYAITRWKYDQSGNLVESSYFGTDEQLKETEDGYAIVRRKYDEFGKGVEVSVFGTDGQLKETETGYTIVRREYDEFGNDAELGFFGTDEQLKEVEEGYAIVRWKYDEFGNQIEESYFGTDGQLKKKNEGYAISRRKYDEFRQAIEESYWGIDEQLTERQDLGGIAIVRWEYQGDGTLTKSIALDKNEKVIFEEGANSSNEAAAISSIRNIVTSQITYSATVGRGSYARNLEALADTDLINSVLGSGAKDGYAFRTRGTARTFTISATPLDYGSTGSRSFFSNETGVIRYTREDRPATVEDPPLGQ